MFKSCCVCVSKKVIENHQSSEETPEADDAQRVAEVPDKLASANGISAQSCKLEEVQVPLRKNGPVEAPVIEITSPAEETESSISEDTDDPIDESKDSSRDIEEDNLAKDIVEDNDSKSAESPNKSIKDTNGFTEDIQVSTSDIDVSASTLEDTDSKDTESPNKSIMENVRADLVKEEVLVNNGSVPCEVVNKIEIPMDANANAKNEDADSSRDEDDDSKEDVTDDVFNAFIQEKVESDSDSSEPCPPPVVRRKSSGILKRPSVGELLPRGCASVADDDDVFGPRAELLARKRSLPAGDAVGRDELAMRRHRVFSELVGAARAAAEHRVRFDPLGPLVAPESEVVQPVALEQLLIRLEQVVIRLEDLLPPPFHSPPPPPSDSSPEPLSPPPRRPDPAMSVQGYQDILQGPLAQYVSLSTQIGGDVAQHSNLVQQAFQAQLQYLTMASTSAAPSAGQQQQMLLPTSQHIQAIQEFREKNRVSPLFNHLSAISESIPALGWVAVTPAPSPYVKEMNDAGQFYTNRVLKDWKEKDKKHVEWCRAWVQTLQEMQAFVKQHHTTGLVWAGKGSCPPPPPCGMPPPPPCLPPMVDFEDQSGDDRNALFAQINQGEDITKSLKKVTSDMQTHKNTALREGPAPFKTPVGAPKPFAKALPTPGAGTAGDKPPVFSRDGKKWLIEYQKGNQNLVVENAEMNNVVYMFRCRDSALTVKGKINSIVLDSCTKCAVVFDSLVSSVEFVNCQSVQMQVLGFVPTVSIDKSDGCQMYLSPDSIGVEIVSSKSSEMNVLIPKGNGDYTELPIAEQFKTTVNKGKNALVTVAVESKG